MNKSVAVFLSAALFTCLVGTGLSFGKLIDWMPINPLDVRKESAPEVQNDADAEAIFWDVHIEVDSSLTVTQSTYLRIKIFTDRGRDAQSTVNLYYGRKSKIDEIAARTIKLDGTIINVAPESVIDRVMARARGVKVNSKFVTMPGVEPGSIIEYQWRERWKLSARYIPVNFQREIPVRSVKFSIKSQLRTAPRLVAFNCTTFLMPGPGGSYVTTLSRVPALQDEPFRPPDHEIRQSALVFLTDQADLLPFTQDIYKESNAITKASVPIQKAATDTIGNASTADEKLRRLYEFCRTAIRTLSNRTSETETEPVEWKRNKTAADTLRQRAGSGADVNLLFAALAKAAGFQARFALVGDRSVAFLEHGVPDPSFLSGDEIAVMVDGTWRFFDPASPFVSYGMLRWQEEGVPALIADPAALIRVRTPLSPPEKSTVKRFAQLRLDEDGTIEGDIRMQYSGHSAAEERIENRDRSPSQREQELVESVRRRMSAAELSQMRTENFDDPEKPVIYHYHVRVPGYAQKAGKRLFLQPGYFAYGRNALFTAGERRYEIYFPFPWQEEDSVIIELPEGYVMDSPDAPARLSGSLGRYQVTIKVQEGRRMFYERLFRFGENNRILFPAVEYTALKKIFDTVHKSDEHGIALKRVVPGDGAKESDSK